MFQPKARRILTVLALLTLFSLAPFAEASAAGQETHGGAITLVDRMEAAIVSMWDSLASIWGDVGPRMDDNG